MKKWLIIIASIILLGWLGIRGIRLQSNKARDERLKFVESLDYDFSGVVDSVLATQGTGVIKFHITRGLPERNHEEVLNKRIKINGILRFLVYKSDSSIAIIIQRSRLIKPGDSIIVKTKENQIRILRTDSLVSESKVTSSLRSRPF